MRRKNLGSRIVKKAITWAMVVMMSFSGVMSGFASMTVYAEKESGSTDNDDKDSLEDDGEDNQESENANESTTTTYYDENGEEVSDASGAVVEVNVTTTEAEPNYKIDGENATAEEASKETLYEVNKETTVETETHYIVTDENGEAVAGTKNGEAVDVIEVSEEYTETEVKVVEKTDEEGNTIQDKVADDATFYKQDEEGNFVEVTEENPVKEGEQLFILAEDGVTYQNVTTTYEVETVDGETVVIDETVKDVLTTGEAQDGYVREKVYVVQVDDAEGNKETVLTITQEELEKDKAKNEEDRQYVDNEDGTVSVKATEETVTIPAKDTFKGYDVTGQEHSIYYDIWKGKYYIYFYEPDHWKEGQSYWLDNNDINVDCWGNATLKDNVITHTDAGEKTVYKIPTDNDGEKEVGSEYVVAKTLYKVTNGSDVTVTVDPAVIAAIDGTKKNYVEVKDGVELTYTDEGNNEQTVLFTAEEWKVLTSIDAKVTETTTYYYTANPEYVTGKCEMEVDGKDYLLTVKFLNNSNKVTVKKDENGNAIANYIYDALTGNVTITVEYIYLDGEGKEQNGIYSKVMSLADFTAAFDKSRMATLTIQYVPTTTSGEEFVLGAFTSGTSEVIGGEEEETQENTGIIYAKTETDANGNVINVPVNEPNNKTFHHVDIKVNTNVTVNGISGVKVTSATVKNSNGKVLGASKNATSDTTGTEFRLNTNINLPGNQVLTFEIELEYLDKDGQKQSLTYVMAIYPTSDSTYNYCKDKDKKENAGFDLFVSDKLVTQAIKEHVESKKETTVTQVETGSRPVESTVTLNTDEEATKSLVAQLITAGVFVRSDGIQQAEDGTTHYASSDYSKDLSGLYGEVLKKGTYDLDKIYLAYTKSGLLVNEANLAELKGKTDEEIAALSAAEKNALIVKLINARLSDGNVADNDLACLAQEYINKVKTAELEKAALEQAAKELGIVFNEENSTYTAAGESFKDLNKAIKAQTEYLASKASTEAQAALDSAVNGAMESLEGLEISKVQYIIKGKDGENITADTIEDLKDTILGIAKANKQTSYIYQYNGEEVKADSKDSLKELVLDKVLDSATEEYVIHYTFADGEPKTYSAGNADEAVSALLKDVEANAQVDGSGRARLQLAGGAYTEYFASIDALKAYVESVAKDTTKAITVYHFDGNDYDNLDAVKAELEKKFDPKESVTYVFDNVEEKNLDDLWDTIKSKLSKDEVEGYEFDGKFYAKSNEEALKSAIKEELTKRLNAANIGLTDGITFTVDGTNYDDVKKAIKAYTDILIASQNIEWYVLKTENDGYHIDGVYRVNNNVAFGHNTSVFNAFETAISIFGSKKTTVDLSLVAVEKHIVNQSKLDSYTTSYQWGFELAQASPAPSSEPTPGGEVTPDVTPDDGGDTTVIIPDAPVALAAAPVAADNGAAVLGARRTDGDAAEAAVLGARRGTEQAVLGKRRKPQTGDTAALNAWMAAMTMAAGAAGISGTKLAKGKKKEEKED